MKRSAKLTPNDEKLRRRIIRQRNLLKAFGLTGYGYDPGVVALDENGDNYDFGLREWRWLEPLLIELRASRRLAKGGGK